LKEANVPFRHQLVETDRALSPKPRRHGRDVPQVATHELVSGGEVSLVSPANGQLMLSLARELRDSMDQRLVAIARRLRHCPIPLLSTSAAHAPDTGADAPGWAIATCERSECRSH
jgi:hypothetical protein